jgi:hypothetical protein
MPRNRAHSEQSRRGYGKSYSEVHRWMDRPSSALHENHRTVRHDFYKTPPQAQRIFGGNAANVVRDHIRLDKETSVRKRFHFF